MSSDASTQTRSREAEKTKNATPSRQQLGQHHPEIPALMRVASVLRDPAMEQQSAELRHLQRQLAEARRELAVRDTVEISYRDNQGRAHRITAHGADMAESAVSSEYEVVSSGVNVSGGPPSTALVARELRIAPFASLKYGLGGGAGAARVVKRTCAAQGITKTLTKTAVSRLYGRLADRPFFTGPRAAWDDPALRPGGTEERALGHIRDHQVGVDGEAEQCDHVAPTLRFAHGQAPDIVRMRGEIRVGGDFYSLLDVGGGEGSTTHTLLTPMAEKARYLFVFFPANHPGAAEDADDVFDVRAELDRVLAQQALAARAAGGAAAGAAGAVDAGPAAPGWGGADSARWYPNRTAPYATSMLTLEVEDLNDTPGEGPGATRLPTALPPFALSTRPLRVLAVNLYRAV